jgi:hypothetical protein
MLYDVPPPVGSDEFLTSLLSNEFQVEIREYTLLLYRLEVLQIPFFKYLYLIT